MFSRECPHDTKGIGKIPQYIIAGSVGILARGSFNIKRTPVRPVFGYAQFQPITTAGSGGEGGTLTAEADFLVELAGEVIYADPARIRGIVWLTKKL